MASLTPTSSINEVKAAKAFSKQAVVFDELYSADRIVQYKRERVRFFRFLVGNGSFLVKICDY